jgi:hypothetical protein
MVQLNQNMIVLSVEVNIQQYLALLPVLAQRILVVDIMYLMKVQKNLIMNVNIAGVGIQQFQVLRLVLVLKTRRGGTMYRGGSVVMEKEDFLSFDKKLRFEKQLFEI